VTYIFEIFCVWIVFKFLDYVTGHRHICANAFYELKRICTYAVIFIFNDVKFVFSSVLFGLLGWIQT